MPPSRSRASTRLNTSTSPEKPIITRPSSTPRSLARLKLNQPAEMPTTAARASTAKRAKTYVAAWVSRCRSAPCWAAANATDAAADNPVAPAQTSTPFRPDPVRAETRAPITRPPTVPITTAPTSRAPSSLAREIGASSSQNPSAAEASTGPNRRLAPSATATAVAKAAHGRTVRADRHDAVVHSATVRWAFSTTLVSIAPIIKAPITATYASLKASITLRVARPLRQSRISPLSSRGDAGSSRASSNVLIPGALPAPRPGSRPARPASVRGSRRRSPTPASARP